MKKAALFLAGLSVLPVAMSADFRVDTFDANSLGITGAQCQFSNKADRTVVASDWGKKYWVKFDGKLIALISHKTEAEDDRDRNAKRLRETLKSNDLTVVLDLVEDGRGEDVIGYKGHVDFRQGAVSKQIALQGDCGA